MGIFKQMKDMKDMVNAAPGLVEQARQLGAQAPISSQSRMFRLTSLPR